MYYDSTKFSSTAVRPYLRVLAKFSTRTLEYTYSRGCIQARGTRVEGWPLYVVQHVYGCTCSHKIFAKRVCFIYGRTKFSVYQLIYMSLYNPEWSEISLSKTLALDSFNSRRAEGAGVPLFPCPWQGKTYYSTSWYMHSVPNKLS